MFEHFAQRVKNSYAPIRISFLNEQEEQYRQNPPFKGLKILHNVPLTTATIIKLNALVVAGAEVTVTSPSFMTPEPTFLQAAIDAGMTWLPLSECTNMAFDVHLDCAAELLDITPPRLGTIELTGTGTQKYQHSDLSFPCISIDLSSVKALETCLGTGEAFVRAFNQLTGKSLVGKTATVFGFGKVGIGIAERLRDIECHVSIVDSDPSKLTEANQNQFTAISSNDIAAVEYAIESSFVVVTATGKTNCIGSKYRRSSFSNCWLANMGAEDEFGDTFSEADVLCEKRPINFSIDEPTRIEYLDPVFYAHNQAIEILLQRSLSNGVHPYPQNISDNIVARWKSIHNIEFTLED
ncbi:Adenosylhomocysteinase [BD1-7 clade bacterium]|uniref:Adenosylhomocysteinase n=1 Tax=BD1-7 clade bacterium TaxID=2029982 RepID=A0A5S9PY15_9GAMM|nr:Adenosylhomocysteinase [BD1-7 clade bacterium]CAA0110008.1 Adenosylhomocysteinase [BD1-7 clade bacterium]CAA0116608.1 Adenosylhomocysteinase [BD1-7 clade bacterium]